MYYDDKLDLLRRMFRGRRVELADNQLRVDGTAYPIVEDVIILLDPEMWPARVKAAHIVKEGPRPVSIKKEFSEETQFTFGVQWNTFSDLMTEHRKEFEENLDLLPLETLRGKVAIDLGCGMGRWSYFLAPICQNVILLDFSEAIFAARRTLANYTNALFFMGDINRLPFASDCADFAFSLGVLHHMPIDALLTVRSLRNHSPELLIYLYYALENRPFYFRALFWMMNALRRHFGKMRNEHWRTLYVNLVMIFVYFPFIALATVLRPLRLDRYVPLHAYVGKSVQRIRQDAYDKLLTRIEQRVTRDQILTLRDTFREITISAAPPYWHFVCKR